MVSVSFCVARLCWIFTTFFSSHTHLNFILITGILTALPLPSKSEKFLNLDKSVCRLSSEVEQLLMMLRIFICVGKDHFLPFTRLCSSVLASCPRMEERASTSSLRAVMAPPASTKVSRISFSDLHSFTHRSTRLANALTAAAPAIISVILLRCRVKEAKEY